jgi:hypothetical protein
MAEERFTRRTVTTVMAVIAVLAFVFSFGNVWALALRLGVPRPIAPLIAPMVDLSVVGLLVALRYLALRGVPKAELKAGTRLLHLCGLLTLALNTAEPPAYRTLRTGLPGHRRPAPAPGLGPRRPHLPRPLPHRRTPGGRHHNHPSPRAHH